MAKKQDSYYFQNFIECAEYSCKAANLLKKTMEQFDVNALPARMEEIHQVEHEADVKKHELLNVLVKAFITPIEREDIMQVSQNLDDLTDKIEDVLIKIYYNGISGMRADSLKLADVIIQCCDEVRKLMNEFADFRKSKKLHEHIVRINSLEEEADKLFMNSMRKLYAASEDPIRIIAWRDIYIYLERCADACEHVADVVESVIMKNS